MGSRRRHHLDPSPGLLFLIALAIGTPLSTAFDAYYRGLWSLLSFTMQMTLILVVSLVLGATPFFKRIVIVALAPAADDAAGGDRRRRVRRR